MTDFARLEIQGTLDLDQFWPHGTSDADTNKLVLSSTGGVRIRRPGAASAVGTTAFDDAVVVTGSGVDGTPTVKRVIDDRRKLTVRLQRIDAPELHYRPDARGSKGKLKGTGLIKDYRQHQAETSTERLATFLRGFRKNPLPCVFATNLPSTSGPSEAIDKYGRFVGDVFLPDGTNLNLWLLEAGLAVVALYDSMRPAEIEESVAAWRSGRKRADGIARHYSARFPAFDPALLFRHVGAAIVDEGARRFIHPKFYRRQTTWWAFVQAGIFTGDFGAWLEAKGEECQYLPEFLTDGKKATRYPLWERDVDEKSLSWEPEDFLFLEAPSRLQRAGRGGALESVTGW